MLGIRLGLAVPLVVTAVAGGLAMFAMACGSSIGNASAGSAFDSGAVVPPDGGSGDATTAADTGTFDEGTGVDAAVATGALFVHASPDFPDVRLCWWVSGDGGTGGPGADPPFPSGAPAPMSDYPAIPIGAAWPLPDASSLLGGDLTIVAIDARGFTDPQGMPAPSCAQRLAASGANSLNANVLRTTFTVPAGTIVAGATNVIAISGCYNDPLIDPSLCGGGFSPFAGNMHANVLPLYEVNAVAPGQLAVQAAQLSPTLAAQIGDAGAVVSFGPQDAAVPVATLVGVGAVAPASAAFLDAAVVPTDYARLGFALDYPTGPDSGAHAWLSLEQSLEMLDPTMNPATYYGQTTTYVVAVVGDTASPSPFDPDAGQYDGHGLHLLVAPLP